MAPKYQQLADILRSEIQKLARQGTDKLATEWELAQRYHMSRQTVRHALELLEEEGLILRRQGSGSYLARQVRSSESRQIAVITTFLDDYIFPAILHDAQSAFSQRGYSTLVCATENRVSAEREILARLLGQNVSALLVEGSKTALPTPNADLYQKLRERRIPVLFLHGTYSNLQGFPCLLDDNYEGGYQLARYLLERGHREVAGIFKSDDVQGPQRYYGMATALRDRGIPLPDRRIAWYDTEDRRALVSEAGSDMLPNFIAHRLEGATAVLCYNDEIAYQLIRQLIKSGRRVPEDVAVVSFDNSYYSQIGAVPITSLGHRADKTGRAAARMLLELLDGGEPKSGSLAWELTVRSSG